MIDAELIKGIIARVKEKLTRIDVEITLASGGSLVG